MEWLENKKSFTNKDASSDQFDGIVNRQPDSGGGENFFDTGAFMRNEDAVYSSEARPLVQPKTLEDTGLKTSFVLDLFMKHAYFMGEFSLQEISGRMKLPVNLLDKVVEALRGEHFIEVKGSGKLLKSSFRYSVTDKGINRAKYLLEQSRVCGPAPVILRDYMKIVRAQTVKGLKVNPESINEAFSDMIVDDRLKERVGPAVHSGKSIFIYGPSGNGKTAIAEAIGRILPGTIYIPYSIIVGGEVMTVYDNGFHKKDGGDDVPVAIDGRWVRIKRPVVMVGGEFTLKLLDLEFNHVSRFYEAPLQIKANNGLFILDDFGRQKENPRTLLNRYIVPLDRRIDFLSLHTGTQFEIPFDQLVIFTTNMEPRELMDEVFLRRIPYKIKIDYPDRDAYEMIFKAVCRSHGLAYREDVFNYLMNHLYQRLGVSMSACHPRDLINHIIDISSFKGTSPNLTNESITAAWESYFVGF